MLLSIVLVLSVSRSSCCCASRRVEGKERRERGRKHNSVGGSRALEQRVGESGDEQDAGANRDQNECQDYDDDNDDISGGSSKEGKRKNML